jgi:hypothetical protein
MREPNHSGPSLGEVIRPCPRSRPPTPIWRRSENTKGTSCSATRVRDTCGSSYGRFQQMNDGQTQTVNEYSFWRRSGILQHPPTGSLSYDGIPCTICLATGSCNQESRSFGRAARPESSMGVVFRCRSLRPRPSQSLRACHPTTEPTFSIFRFARRRIAGATRLEGLRRRRCCRSRCRCRSARRRRRSCAIPAG